MYSNPESALIDRLCASTALEPPQIYSSVRGTMESFAALDDPVGAVPSLAHRLFESVGGILSELLKPMRYEERAAARRDKAVRTLSCGIQL